MYTIEGPSVTLNLGPYITPTQRRPETHPKCLLQLANPLLIHFEVGPTNTLCDQYLTWQLLYYAAAPPAESTGRFLNGTKGILTPTSEFDSSFTDSSSTLYSLYLSHAEKYDKYQAETWKAGAEGILVFVRSTLLFGSSSRRL
jgi:hypothetical protein